MEVIFAFYLFNLSLVSLFATDFNISWLTIIPASCLWMAYNSNIMLVSVS